jgi:hypothetical protein
MKTVYIKWLDSTGGDGWLDLDRVKEKTLNEIETVGLLVKESEDSVLVTMAYDSAYENVGAWLLIPRVAITSMRELEQKEESTNGVT